MSLEKSIKKLTQVIQARKPYVGDPSQRPPREQKPSEFVGPLEPPTPLPPMPEDGWECYNALKGMQEDTKKMEYCCTLPPDVFTTNHLRCYYRDTPGGPIKTR